ncbi:MAG TPA: toll/interleukin-1 receptor domain-containing protein [Anaerolineales bacterium]|nr:toll/interleukin-1 receptor domain-containing protein [Anaerolineales bacterium]
MNDLFLSYASEDRDKLVRPVAEELRRRGLSIWMDEGEIVPGVDFVDAIQSGMKSAHAVVLFLTGSFLAKRWPMLELNNFLAMGKPLIPVVPDLSVENVLEAYPLLSSTFMMTNVRESQEIARRIEHAYNFIRTSKSPELLAPEFGASLNATSGVIKVPADGSLVDHHIIAEGIIKSLPESAWLWLVVEIGELKWPKEPGVFVSGNSWTGEAYEGGQPPDGRFSLCLYVVDEKGHKQIKNWIRDGHRTGSYPGISVIKDARRLDRVQLRLQ